MSSRRVLVVGGANGIGLVMALCWAQRDDIEQVYVVDKAPLDASHQHSKIKAFQFDLTTADYSFFDRFTDIDTLMVTAGFGHMALFRDVNEQHIRQSFEVNTLPAMRLARRFYSRLEGSEPFHMGVMVSIAGFMSSPFFSVYAATKAALKIFIESINVELEKAGSRNRILNVSPGKVRGTKFHDDDTDIERVTPLAKDIISHLESGDDLFIPLYNEVYRQVLERYHDDFRAEGRHSYEYKQNISSFNPEGSLLRRQQHRMTEMLLVLDDICRRHGIRYWLAAGTLLGAVRHKGYIPWDDDLDIEMLREDYDRLLRILPKELPEHLQLQTPETDAGYFLAYAKLRDRRSRLSETNAYDRIFEMQGIFIDIFPMERVPSFLRWVSCRTIGRCYKVLKRKNLTDDEARRRVRRIYEVNRRFIFPILNALSAITPFKRKIRYSLGVPYDDIRLDKWLFPLTTTAFEGHQFPVPANCEAYLTSKFGNWRQLPDLSTIHAHAAHLEINE